MTRIFYISGHTMGAAMNRVDPPYCITCRSRGDPDKIYVGQRIVTKEYRTSGSTCKTQRRHYKCAEEVNIV